jgi:beta-xylosidase
MLDKTHANSHTAWAEMGCPQPPTAEQLERLHEASRLVSEPLGDVVATDGQVKLVLALNTHSISLLELVPV